MMKKQKGKKRGRKGGSVTHMSPVAVGVAGAIVGAVSSAAIAAVLTDKRTRRQIVDKLGDFARASSVRVDELREKPTIRSVSPKSLVSRAKKKIRF